MRVRIRWSSLPAILCILYLVGSLSALVLNSHPDSIIKRFTPQHAQSEAEAYVDLLRTNQFDQIKKDLDPSIVSDDTNGQLAFMASLIPAQKPLSIKVVGVHTTAQANLAGSTSSERNIILEYEFPDKWLVVNLVTRRQNGTQTIVVFNVNQLQDSLEHSNRLTLAGKGGENYAILIMFLVDMGLTLYVLVLCVRAGASKRNWYWPILCLIGVGKFALNWTTGESNFTPIWIGIPPGGADGTFYSPWTVYAAIPLGAIVFLLYNRRQPQPPQIVPGNPADTPLPDATSPHPGSAVAGD